MGLNINPFKDLYNQAYIQVNKLVLNKDVLKDMDLKMRECVADLEFSQPSDKMLRSVKAKIIKEYYNIPKSEKGNLPENLVITASINATRKLAVHLIPKTPLVLQSDFIFAQQKEKYLQDGVKNSDKCRLFLASDDIKKIAHDIDKDLTENLTLQQLAELVAIEYKTKIQSAIRKTGGEAGADDLAEACLAILLLQKNDRFKDAITQLAGFAEKDSRFSFLTAACNNYLGPITEISQLSH